MYWRLTACRVWGRRIVMLAIGACLAACSITGETFQSSGLDHIVAGRTTLAQAADYLGAQPTGTWAQGDGSVLARWGYTGTLATDAVYFRQEVLLRFGPDGRFERMEHSVNLPVNRRPRMAAQAGVTGELSSVTPTPADNHPSASILRDDVPQVMGTSERQMRGSAAPQDAEALPVAAPLPPLMDTPLLAPGTQVTPQVTYPLNAEQAR